ncbi:MAG: DUF2786 domain-containing protein, partial [Deltaproteobacteria bacterium]|jgi:hypothetical protein|nr:DUF2786 domain-containing protein [Deltaproteobacteria bacterium]
MLTAWTRQLTYTHGDLLRLAGVKGSVLPATIEICDSDKYWGKWDPSNRVISINFRVIKRQPWHVVEAILGHETAHQMVSDLSRAAAYEPDHGPTFQKAAEMLRLHPLYRQASIDILESGPPPLTIGPFNDNERFNNHKLLNKIKKLLSLAQSPEPHEAETALAMASRLMTKYNIDQQLIKDKKHEDYERWYIDLNTTKIPFEAYLIAQILAQFFFVEPIITSEYDHKLLHNIKKLELSGRPVNLHMAHHVYHFLKERTKSLWLHNKPRLAALGEKGIGAKNAFVKNLLNSFRNKLYKSQNHTIQQDTKKPNQLILQINKDLKKYIVYHHPNLYRISTQAGGSFAPNSSAAGYDEGQKLNLYIPVGGAQSSSPGSGGRLLE